MHIYENRKPGFVSVQITHTMETEREAQEIMETLKKLLARQNARRKHDGRPAMAFRVEMKG